MSTSRMNGTDDAVSTMGATDAASVEVLPPLADIWKCSKISQYTDCNGKKKWICAWCPPGSTHFTGWNTIKVLWHVCKVSSKEILPCKGFILPNYARVYKDYYENKIIAKSSRTSR